ncbi:hypothetical protein HX785_02215 [Pseudomonas reactans]|uniref:hypothetical protein n=1 Tax=Pseudomonas reactans TaxID=117680 RepID=UPI0015A2642A|nr:hypothetical protein [Pseudomonas reactans]NWF12486.1 hypothetical protein [Pseudomonas reactans]
MDYAQIANVASLGSGLLSAAFWVVSAKAKAPLPPEFEGMPDGSYWKIDIFNGGDLSGTMRLQAKWNSRAAVAAAATVLLQIAANMLSA